MFPNVTLFGKDIGTYSLCVIAGILALMLCTWLLARRRGLAPDANLDSARQACGRYGVPVEGFDRALEMFNQTNPALEDGRASR